MFENTQFMLVFCDLLKHVKQISKNNGENLPSTVKHKVTDYLSLSIYVSHLHLVKESTSRRIKLDGLMSGWMVVISLSI